MEAVAQIEVIADANDDLLADLECMSLEDLAKVGGGQGIIML